MRVIGALILAIVVFGAGLYWGRSQASRAGLPVECPVDSTGSMRSKMQLIADTDFKEYQRLKTLEEKYKKADEILAKIMTIFIADLGLRLNMPAKAVAGAMPGATTPQAPEAAKSGLSPHQAVNAKPSPKSSPAPAGAPKDTRSVSDLHGPQDEADFLTNNKLDDVEQALRAPGVGLVSADRLADLNGNYHGTASVQLDGKPHTWDVAITLNAHYDGDKVGGTSSIALSENGKDFSKSGDEGNITSYKESQSDRQVLYIRASPTTYFQMYKTNDAMIGNVYRRPDSELPFVYVGTVNLQKVR